MPASCAYGSPPPGTALLHHRGLAERLASGAGCSPAPPFLGGRPRPSRSARHLPVCANKVTAKPKLVFVGSTPEQALEGMSAATAAAWAAMDAAGLRAPPISRGDDYFADKGLEFVEGLAGVDLADLNDLFERVGFPRRDPEKLKVALANTHRLLWVRSTRKSRFAREGQLVGFARATGDGALSATVWDVAVHPAWQRIGLGRALMERLTARLVDDGISTITLYAEPKVVAMYEKLGFVQEAGFCSMGFSVSMARARRPSMAAA